MTTKMRRSDRWRAEARRQRGLSELDLQPLCELAADDGAAFLSSFVRGAVPASDLLDLVQDALLKVLLSGRLQDFLDADSPWAYFKQVLVRRVYDWQRQKSFRERRALLLQSQQAQRDELNRQEEDRWNAHLDGHRQLVRAVGDVSSRDLEILVRAMNGDTRTSIARRFGTTRANVDQIVRRVRIRLSRVDP